MQKILENLMGTMDTECTSPDRQEFIRDQTLAAGLEQTILEKLGKNGLDLFLQYNCRNEKLHQQQTTEAFVRGFRYGARLMAAVFDDEFV